MWWPELTGSWCVVYATTTKYWETKLKERRKSQKIICGIWTPPAHSYIVVVDPLRNKCPEAVLITFKCLELLVHILNLSSWKHEPWAVTSLISMAATRTETTPRPTWTMAGGIGVIGVAARQQRFLWIFVYGCLTPINSYVGVTCLVDQPLQWLQRVPRQRDYSLLLMPLAHILPRPCHGVLDQCIVVI